jgi:hypothetical protein
MPGPSNAFANSLLKNIFRGESVIIPATWYLALYTAAPTDSGGGTEVFGAGYARLALTKNTSVFTDSTARQVNLSTTGSFPEAAANWGTITAVALFDASTGGNMLWWGNLDSAQVINTGDTFRIPAGSAGLRITL